MIAIARIYIALSALAFLGLGCTGLFSPETIIKIFHLQPESAQGWSEIRALYGGANISWFLIALCALLHKTLSRQFLVALAIMLTPIALARVISMVTDHEFASNIPSFITEALIPVACWVLYKRGNSAKVADIGQRESQS